MSNKLPTPDLLEHLAPITSTKAQSADDLLFELLGPSEDKKEDKEFVKAKTSILNAFDESTTSTPTKTAS